ncbi:hypothetical protein FPF71_17820 [Algibacter amylolyticus]|uniref:Lipoprotein n=1 Tax=Algibacter amylolyticus TaxID=1608400 RepID=A0A5M7ARD4_9FLAO|nr:hypothetical protein [Algibacter amylolyticus]KAA5820156.1 hypothetical protein F2B50_17820 [Algibacter amylolyticus]MBB5270011.1 hypothetical protein [Algibacter amylolyticus]TSJ70410.1 hypothetical protein FPF71_17820 [Algibacter amylolyticus]
MKELLSLILIFSILSSCDRKKSDKTQSEFKPKTELTAETESEPKKELEAIQSKVKKDTINNYWALILDTISSKKEFKISDLKHTLELNTYSLNDSSIVRNLAQEGEQAYLDHSHKMVTDFKLLIDSIVDKKQIDRTDFGKALIPEFYTECNLSTTEIDSISGNIVYLNSSLAVPDTGNIWRVLYSIKIKDNQIGEIEIIETDYVGM